MRQVHPIIVLFFLGTSATLSSCAVGTADCSGDIGVYAQDDLNVLAGCRSYTGTIMIESTPASSLMLPGIKVLNGDVVVKNNTALGHMTFPDLQVVSGALKFSGNLLLSKIDWPSLTGIKELSLSVLPSLSAVSFPSGLYKASKITVSDTTAARIDGLKLSNVSEITIDNNYYLKVIDVGDNFKQVTKTIFIGSNSPELSLDLSHLKELQTGTLSNLAQLSLSNLENVHRDISLLSNHFQSLNIPNLMYVNGSLTLADNSKLEKLSIPELQRLGGALSVSNNTRLTSLDAFPKLEEVHGTIDLAGSFNEVKVPKLQDVRGGLSIQTSSDTFSCNAISTLRHGVIKGKTFMCQSHVINPKSGIHKSSIDYNGKSSGTPAIVKTHPAHVVFWFGALIALSIL